VPASLDGGEMEIGTEVKTIDGKVGKIIDNRGCWVGDYHWLVKGKDEDGLEWIRMYLGWQLTPIPPEEKREWFWNRQWAGCGTKADAIADAKATVHAEDLHTVRVFRLSDGEKVE